ncbi:hypothetical protein NP233_g1765 [Leucocoprinus birnbaumii]|uniref:Fungal lipase-type domain-containing protein n=1 Tax=Leucocoprinus birnbaumii TaxID=56174 RepID=A0AAD5VZJ7_9AGAR|nr:hypothetical protein NP233_g1765 [Leucocoprinus birnbaumii]
MHTVLFSSSFVLAILTTQAVGASKHIKRHSPTALTPSEINAYAPLTRFASAAYCQTDTTQSWTCGDDCAANADFKPVAVGGNGLSVQFWYVGFSPSLNSVIVAHQGTDNTKLEPLLTDAMILLRSLDPGLFPGLSSNILVHAGFAGTHAQTATAILSAVRQTITKYQAKQVTIVGHSLGGALALLDGVYLPLHIKGVSFRTVTYAMSKVGNQAFADYVDANVSLTHINNKDDPIPRLPPAIPLLLDYHQTSGEIHIVENGNWISCPGQENPSPKCTSSNTRTDIKDHYGPYNGVIMGGACAKVS